jgi:hypothetical protein
MFAYPLNPGPSWNVPRVSAPSCLGLLAQYEIEWWYYTGVVESGDERFSVQLSIDRIGSGALGVSYALFALARASDDRYVQSIAYAVGVTEDPAASSGLVLAPVNDATFSLDFTPLIGTTVAHVRYTGGGSPVGMTGSTYALEASGTDDASNPLSVELSLADERGLVLEGESGYVGPGMPGTGPIGGGAATY